MKKLLSFLVAVSLCAAAAVAQEPLKGKAAKQVQETRTNSVEKKHCGKCQHHAQCGQALQAEPKSAEVKTEVQAGKTDAKVKNKAATKGVKTVERPTAAVATQENVVR